MKAVCAHPKPCNKRNFYFKAILNLVELNLHHPKGGDLTFECIYIKNTISSKGFYRLSSVLPSLLINETLEIPFQALFDRRKQTFFCEPLQVNIINMHQSFRKRLGSVQVSLATILNAQQVSLTSVYKIEKSSDKNGVMKINVHIKYLGNTEIAKNLLNIEESYFQDQSQS